ncbi:MAG: amino acid aminotransferase [Pirellulaceae bacterium]
MFESLEAAPPDAILGLNEAFAQDPNPAKINLSVGVYKDSDGKTPVLEVVKQAERQLLESETTKSYLGIGGDATYAKLVQNLLFAADDPILTQQRAATIHAPGGTGALRVAADFVRTNCPNAQVWCSNPTWANHQSIFQAAGLNCQTYAYLDAPNNCIDFEALIAALHTAAAGDVVLLHGCCHNPSGVDPTIEQWQEIASVINERKLLPLVDFAYQGFGDGLEEDAAGLRTIASQVPEFLVASSFSKNFGLYRERVGALTFVGPNQSIAQAVLSHIKKAIRANYSNPPAHGGLIVQTILADANLTTQWHGELAAMRQRIHDMRSQFVEKMASVQRDRDFSFIRNQRGMFSFSGLNPEQVQRLRNEHSIYIVGSGRINVAGITAKNIDTLCNAIVSVL